MRSALRVLLFLSGTLLHFASASDFVKDEIYIGCGGKTKTCFGDVDGCLLTRNCTFVVAAIENRTHYIAEIQNNCNVDSKNVFFGVGVHALFKETPQSSPTYKCTPKFEDFKFIILWEGEKCPNLGVIQKKWGHMVKGLVPPCDTSPPVSNLLGFVQKSMLVRGGEIPTSLIENKDYMEKNDGAFFTSAATTFQNPFTTILAFILTSSVYKAI